MIETTGTVVEDGTPGTFLRRIEFGTGRLFEMVDLGIIRRGRGFDGALAWSQDASGATHDLNSPFTRALAVSQAWLDARQGCLSAEAAGQTFAGTRAEGTHQFDILAATPAHGAPIELWYNKASGELERALLQEPESRVARHFGDWRALAGGHRIPFLERDEDIQDESETVFRVTAVEMRATARQDDFRRPAQPRDAALLGPGPVTEIPYSDDHRTRIYLPVYLNGHGPFTFELDAGGHLILSEKTAASIGLAPKGAFSSTGAGEAVAHVGFVHVSQIRIGQAIMSNQTAKILPLGAQANDRGQQPPRAGILGLELFERFTVGLDRRHKTVSLRLRGAPYDQPAGQAIPLLFDEDAPLIRGEVEGHAGTMMLDPGNTGATIVEDFWAQKAGLAKSLSRGLSYGDGVHYAPGRIQVGNQSFGGETLSYYGPASRGSEYTRSVAAILGEPFLSRFDAVIDYARQTIWLQPLPDRDAAPFNRSGLLLDKTPGGPFTVSGISGGSPAALAGLKKGDLVDAIAGTPARLLSRADANALFRQPAGSAVPMEISAAGHGTRTVRLVLRDELDNAP